MVKLYDWQKTAVNKWIQNDMKGYIVAPTGSGKTLGGVLIISWFLDKYPNSTVIIAAHRKRILKQWKDELDIREHRWPNAKIIYSTYQTLSNKEEESIYAGLFVADEIHRATSEKFRLSFKTVNYYSMIGFTATPIPRLQQLFGKPFIKVPLKDVPSPEIEIENVYINLEPDERIKRKKLSKGIARLSSQIKKRQEQGLEYANREHILKLMIMKRRRITYNAHQRIETAMDLIKREWRDGQRVITFSRTIAQAELLCWKLNEQDIAAGIQHSGAIKGGDLELYLNGDIDILCSVQQLLEGFNDPSTTVAIAVSFSITPTALEQMIGRLRRRWHGVDKKFIFIIAKETSDEKKDSVKVSKTTIPFHKANKYFWDYRGEIFQKKEGGRRIYYECTNIDLKAYFYNHKPKGGMFKLYGMYLLIPIEGEILELTLPRMPQLTRYSSREFDIHKKWTSEDLEDFLNRVGERE